MRTRQELEAEARALVDSVWEKPLGRLELRQEFYKKYGFSEHGPYGYGNSEIAFLKWEIRRGVLNAREADQPGSPWWKGVNGDFLYYAELAGLVQQSGAQDLDWPVPVRHWLEYIQQPGGQTWYRAHNSSIIHGYLNREREIYQENRYERSFVNIVLYRLLYAQSLVEGATVFGELGKILADPSGPAVGVLVHLPDFYPTDYPLTHEDYRDLMGRAFTVEDLGVRILDDDIILPELDSLYHEAARWNATPRLVLYVEDGKAIYPKHASKPALSPSEAAQRERVAAAQSVAPLRAPEAAADTTASRPQKIAILGGGIGALAAAWELTSYPDWQQQYEITLYQVGWRLGGKMSTGRGPHDRVEEVGLHLLLGFYVNAFPLFMDAYKERTARGLAPESPYKTLPDAIAPNNGVLLVNYNAKQATWKNWPMVFPTSEGYPGVTPPLTTWEIIERGVIILLETALGTPCSWGLDMKILMHWLLNGFSKSRPGQPCSQPEQPHDTGLLQGIADKLRAEAETLTYKLSDELRSRLSVLGSNPVSMPREGEGLLHGLLHYVELLFLWLEHEVEHALKNAEKEAWPDTNLGHLYMIFDFGLALLKGMLKDVYNPKTGKFEYRRINDQDFRAWLKSHGAHEVTLYGPVVTFFYNGTFESLDDGNQQGGLLAAGTALQFALPAIGYQGSFTYQLRLGTADTLIMPLYQVLAARGVKFQFFHKVTNIAYTSPTEIEEIQLEQQVQLMVPEYNPILWVKGSPCWPSHPLWDQIDPLQAAELRAKHIDLESPWAPWQGQPKTLVKGVDFDQVILGIPAKAQASITKEIMAARPDWRAMVEQLRTAQVMSAQLWFQPNLAALGFKLKDWGMPQQYAVPNVVTYANPMFSWLDQTYIIESENWPAQSTPRMMAMFTGVLPDQPTPPPDADPAFPEKQTKRVRDMFWQWLMDNMGWFLKDATAPAYPAGLDLSLLQGVDPATTLGQRKFFEQFFIANVAPSYHYVLAAPGTERYRLRPGGSGFNNLFLVGDWTDYGTNVGYMEGCVVSANEAVRALLTRLGRSEFRPYWKDELADWSA